MMLMLLLIIYSLLWYIIRLNNSTYRLNSELIPVDPIERINKRNQIIDEDEDSCSSWTSCAAAHEQKSCNLPRRTLINPFVFKRSAGVRRHDKISKNKFVKSCIVKFQNLNIFILLTLLFSYRSIFPLLRVSVF